MSGMPSSIKSQQAEDWKVVYTSDVPANQLLAWLELAKHWTPEQGPACGERLGNGQVFRLQSSLGTIVIKHKQCHGFKGFLSRLGLRELPLRRSFRLGCLARQRGLHTPTPLACFQQKTQTGFRSFLITRYLEAGKPWQMLEAPQAEVDAMLASIGREVAAWHLNGLRNRDLKGPNLLYDKQQHLLYIIDLDGTHACGSTPRLEICGRNLGRLKAGACAAGLSDSRWQTVLDAYLQEYLARGSQPPSQAALCAIINARAARKLRRYQRQNRPIS